ncbi:MAG: zinc-ribbon domain-containing protein [Selenomonadaceae bacterium]|nr:zinc-ribbon domain-containing protein [Selenomonadaceae bacterium]
MAYCTNCGKKEEDNARFCSNCGKPIAPAANTRQAPPPSAPQGQQNSGWLRSFLVGTGIGMFLSNLFGHSSSASASSRPSTTEQHHETVIYDHRSNDNENNLYEHGYENNGDWTDDSSGNYDDYDNYNDNSDYDSYDNSYDSGFDDSFDNGFDDY